MNGRHARIVGRRSGPHAGAIAGNRLTRGRFACGGAIVLLAAVLASSEVTAQTIRASVDCSGVRTGAAEREQCASQDLRRLAARIDDLTSQLERTLTGRDREALIDTELPFVRQRNDCQNRDSGLHECVEQVLRHRFDALSAASAKPSSILTEVTQYTFLDVPFVLRWGSGLVGKRVRVWGSMTLSPGPTPAKRTRGVIRDGAETGAHRSLEATFRTMNEDRADSFYDAKQPVTYWEGTVARVGGRFVLTDLEP